eukprot:TRINITY_DN3653_c0_g1_i2.p1 TRINITY_DN3653_c0_g1~~TRINITY_DN3653_c0_g1_i2.p1  ORF type:complete len:270 (+),score=36.40 TRINITY_DN3653_c0_g1_i2:88-897(+)
MKIIGNNLVFFNGRAVCGPKENITYFVGTQLTFLSAIPLFWKFIYGELPYSSTVNDSILATMGLITILGSILHWIVACTDPGIIPRNALERSVSIPRTEDENRTEEKDRDYKYCDTCHILRPERASHCRVCDNCIEGFDHHCPWVMNCIGKRNYRIFVWFLTLISSLMLVIIICSAGILIHEFDECDGSFLRKLWCTVKGQPLISAVLFWGLTGMGNVVFMSGFHMFLIAKGETSKERYRDVWKNKTNPYSKGCFKNCLSVCCEKVPPR